MSAYIMDMKGCQFMTIGSNSLDIQSIIPSPFGEGGDTIMLFNAGSTVPYTTYTYQEWTTDVPEGEDNLGPGWADDLCVRAKVTLDPGQGFWITMENNGTLTIPGEVKISSAYETIDMQAYIMDMLTSPYPMQIPIQNILPVPAGDGADTIMLFNAGSTVPYTTYTYQEWTTDVPEGEDDLGPGWADDLCVRAKVTVDPGQGFWITMEKDGVLKFVNPMAE